MNIRKRNYIPEKSKDIPIKNLLKKESHKLNSEYEQKENYFDPSKSSPPNEFIIKLKMRIGNY